MYHIIPIPIVILAVIVKLVCDRYKLKIFSKICNFIIVVGVIAFIYFYTAYMGYDILEYLRPFFEF